MKASIYRKPKGSEFAIKPLISTNEFPSGAIDRQAYIKRLVQEGEVVPIAYGLYRGKDARDPTFREVVEFRYIGGSKNPTGFWAGTSFRELLHGRDPTALMEPEVITEKSTSGRKRTLLMGRNLTLRKPWAPIEKRTLAANAFLSYLVLGDVGELQKEASLLRNYIRRNQIGTEEISALSPHFPAKASKRLVELGLHKVLWRG